MMGINLDEDANIIPQTLFRFRSENTKHCFEEELRQAVQHDQIWCAPISEQNDPFDANPYFSKSPENEISQYISNFRDVHGPDMNITGTNLREFAKQNGITDGKALKHLMSPKNLAAISGETIIKSYLDVRNASKIACFSEAFDSILLWSHYANSHEGVCLEYETGLNFGDSYSNPKLVRMKYSESRPTISQIEAMKYIGHQVTGDQTFISKAQADDIFGRSFLTKSKQWEYEQEWRWVDELNTDPSGYKIMLPMKVKSITVGARASVETIALCKKVSSAGKGVPIYKVKLSDSTFSFEREEI